MQVQKKTMPHSAKLLMIPLTLLTIFNTACNGPIFELCITLSDLQHKKCGMTDHSKPEVVKPIQAGDYSIEPSQYGILLNWIESHK